MYIPKYNKSENHEDIFRFMHENPFAIIVSTRGTKIIATHVPVEIEVNEHGESVIRTHIAKANLQWNTFTKDKEILVIFNGPHTYISSSWYDHVNVPTWNYIAVHVYGKVKILNDEGATGVLERLVSRYEKNSIHPFSMEKLDAKFMKSHLKALVAFEISMDKIEAKEKLSQNRDVHNLDLIMEQLDKREDADSKKIKIEMDRVRKKKNTKK